LALTSQCFGKYLSYDDGAVSLSEVISAMTFALDITEGAVPGHGLRSCLLGMRLAEGIGLPEEMRVSLYYALQLKDVGCSSNATRMTQIIGGDDRAMKASTKLEDWRTSGVSLRGLGVLWSNILPGKSLTARVARFIQIAQNAQINRKEMIELRCERGAQIVRQLEMEEEVAEAVRRVDEHWDGGGYPDRLKGEQIPVISRICSIAQNLDVFAIEDSIPAAMKVLRKRSGIWFDPAMVRVVERLQVEDKFWEYCRSAEEVEETRQAVLRMDPGERSELTPERVDRICEAFASVVDAKSPFTYRHSICVAALAVKIAVKMGLMPERIQLVRRAALLHDIGKLYVPNTILDKAGKLTPEEWAIVVEHPKMTRSILERVSAFRELAVLAAEHHEKIDGTGYPQGLKGKDMAVESRILVVADVFTAMAEDRSYRRGMATEDVLAIMEAQTPDKLDSECFAALKWVTKDGKFVTPFVSAIERDMPSCLYPQPYPSVEEELLSLI
jgi:putative nucleotidyltransferase with HDIG domain